jgi:hypothetical protein
MKQLIAAVLLGSVALTCNVALAADAPKDATATKKPVLEKPADVTAEAWAKMSDAEKQKAVEAAKAKAAAKSTPPKKEKKGGC